MNRFTIIFFAIPLFFFTATTSVRAEQNRGLLVAGWLEAAVLSPWKIRLPAKLDTGAKTSSIHATGIEKFKRDGRIWVRFKLPKGKLKKTGDIIAETPLLREVAIKRHNLDPAIRPVVELAFCIDSHFYRAEFTLADRSKFNYPVLLGRRFLKNNILVDAGQTFIYHDKKEGRQCVDAALKKQKEEHSRQ